MNADFDAKQPERLVEEQRMRAEEERVRPAEERRRAKVEEMAQQIADHGPCRAFPRHADSYADTAGNCTACVVGLR